MRCSAGDWYASHGTNCSCCGMLPGVRMPHNRRNLLALGAVALLGLLAVMQYWVASRRPLSPELSAAQELQVISDADRGPGSLREAIFTADSAHQRVRILLRVSRIVLQSPLPPLVNPRRVIIESAGNHPEIDPA